MTPLVEKVLVGDIRTVARLITDIDDNVPGTREILKDLYPYTGKANVIGITGSPGVGKSTLVDQMLKHLRSQGKTVGILAVDPTSPFSGGAILGDRIRMQQHSTDPGVFIRSLATRGHFGGITQSTRCAIDVLDAMGKEYVIVETVGVGQDEVDIVKSAHTTVVVVIPGMGDDIQAIKAGILEVGDIFVINKAEREGADKTFADLRLMIEMNQQRHDDNLWKPVVLKAEAIADSGIVEFLATIDKHIHHLKTLPPDFHSRRKQEKVRESLADMVKDRLLQEVYSRLIESGAFQRAVQSIIQGDSDPYSVVDELVRPARELFLDQNK